MSRSRRCSRTKCPLRVHFAAEPSVNIETVLSKAAGILKCDMDLYRESPRIAKSDKADRDLLIYIAWQLGVATNQETGEKFGLT